MRALVVEKDEQTGKTSARVNDVSQEQLPEGNVTVAVAYSTLNYKDGLCIGPGGGLVRNYPHVPGIDFSGVVEQSDDPRYQPGDHVVHTGWRVGENRWGGYAQKARVNADWLVPLPEGLTLRQAMAIGTAGFAAMLGIIALEDHGVGSGPVLVTGASGGVGSVAIAVLDKLGYEVAAVTGRVESADYLKELGASEIIARDTLSEISPKPLESEKWGGCIDAVGGAMLARVLGQLQRDCSAAAIGLAAGADLPAKVVPFLLRGVNLLGINSVDTAYEPRARAWQRLATDLPLEKLEAMIETAQLEDLPQLGRDILKGQIKGRVVVEIAAEL